MICKLPEKWVSTFEKNARTIFLIFKFIERIINATCIYISKEAFFSIKLKPLLKLCLIKRKKSKFKILTKDRFKNFKQFIILKISS